jgi:uncharacterized RmlC-like cupin family protein
MPKIQALPGDSLAESPSSPGITRHLAFKGEGFLVLRARTVPGVVSGWHHHGDHDVYGYVVSGKARFESGAEGSEVITVVPGDFFHVPAHTVHRESNPSAEDLEVILFLEGMGPLVTNVDAAG